MAVSRSLSLRHLIIVAVAIAGLISWGYAAANVRTTEPRIIEAHAVDKPMSHEEVGARAQVIAVVVPTGKSVVHWSSADNTEWTQPLDTARSPMILRDDDVQVVQAIRGAAVGDVFTVRGAGGTVNAVTYKYDGQTDWDRTTKYLVFLERADTPTKEGFESAWTLVNITQAAFTKKAGSYVNRLGVGPTAEEVLGSIGD